MGPSMLLRPSITLALLAGCVVPCVAPGQDLSHRQSALTVRVQNLRNSESRFSIGDKVGITFKEDAVRALRD